MDATRRNRSPLRAVTLAGLTLAAVVTACDSEGPTAIDDALLDALANADGTGPSISDIVKDHLAAEARPLLFVDHVEVTGSDDDFYAPLDSLDPNDIARVEIIKGQAAADLLGDRGAQGVIHIFRREYWETLDLDATGRPQD